MALDDVVHLVFLSAEFNGGRTLDEEVVDVVVVDDVRHARLDWLGWRWERLLHEFPLLLQSFPHEVC